MTPSIKISGLVSLSSVSVLDVMPIVSRIGGTPGTYQARVEQIAPVRSVNGQTGDVAFGLTASNVGYLNAAGSANPSSLQQHIDAQPIYVQTWMTSADGTDVKPAIQRIKDAGLLGSGAHVVLPRGNYTASGGVNGGSYLFSFVSCSSIVVEGSGRGTTTIVATSAANIGFVNCVSLENATFRNFTFDANRPNQTSTAGIHGLRGNTMTNVLFEDLEIKQTISYGFGAQAGTFTNVRLNRCKFDRPGADGIDFKNPNSANSGCTVNEVEVVDWARRDPSVAKAAIDVRGLVEVTNCIARWTDVSSTAVATNHVAYRARPDASSGVTYSNVSPAIPVEGELVASVSSGATARVRVVSGSASLTQGGVGLEEVVGTFVPGNLITFGANTATIVSYTAGSDNGGGGSTFTNCIALGPTTTTIGVGFALLDDGARIVGGSARNQKTGITIQSGGTRAVVLGTEIVDAEIGIDNHIGGARIYGPRLVRATDAAIDIVSTTNTVVDGAAFVSCTRSIRRNAASYDVKISNLNFDATPLPVNFDWGDQLGGQPRTASRSGTIFSTLPTTSYATAVSVSGGAGGAANSRIYFYPLPLYNDLTTPRFFGTVVGTAVAGASAKMALYRDLGNTPTSAPRLLTATSALNMAATANTQQRISVDTTTTLAPGLYWLAFMANANAAPYTVPVSGNAGEWARYVGVNDATALLAGGGAQCRVASVSLFDYDAGLPAICPAVTFEAGAPGSPFLFLQG